MQVDERTAAASSVFEGSDYYFCSAGCKTKFEANPTAYAGKARAGAPERPASASPHAPPTPPSPTGDPGAVAVADNAPPGMAYTCPMHPEVLRDAPGDCPICGMALVPIAGSGVGPTDDSELRDLARRLWVGVALSIPLVVLAMSPMIGFHDLFGLQPRPRGWIEFVLGTPVVLWVGWPILRKFWFSLVHRTSVIRSRLERRCVSVGARDDVGPSRDAWRLTHRPKRHPPAECRRDRRRRAGETRGG